MRDAAHSFLLCLLATRIRLATFTSMNLDSLKHIGARGSLSGKLLIAMPSMPDRRFNRAVIYICAHSSEGAMGLVVNRRVSNVALPELLVQLDVINAEQMIRLPDRAAKVDVLAGGPVETTRGFVLHSTDMVIDNATLPVGENIGLTITLDMLRAIARGEGPSRAVLALGYASWSAGQLESEIKENTWLHGNAEADILFGLNHAHKYERALQILGVSPAFLSMDAGNA